MAGLRDFLGCIGEAICANGLKALAGLMPLGGAVYEIAENVWHRLRESKQDKKIQQLVESTAVADAGQVKVEAEALAANLAADQSPQVRANLVAYLQQVPVAVRQSLRRPADPSGRSVPAHFAICRGEDLLHLLPIRLPRFSVGDHPAGLSDWELCELLGIGGFGEVWKARHRTFDGIAPVVFKFCLDPLARDLLLKHEAMVLNQVMRQGRHPGIVPLLDASLSSDPPYLKYEYIEGGDLAGLLRDWPETSPRWRLASELLARVAQIVAFAHRLTPPIVHRDLKPANILLQKEEGGRKDEQDLLVPPSSFLPKVTDFGIGGVAARQALAEVRQGTMTRGDLLGTELRGSHTPLYASPQQVRGEPPDPRDDVHALGVIWYQMLTGDLHTGAPTGLWADELEEQGVPREVIRLLGSCVARPEKRPRDAGELAQQLDALLVPTPVPIERPRPAPLPAAPAPQADRLEHFLRTGRTGALSGMLDLTNKGIGDAGAIALAGSLRLANLSVLILSGCDIGDEGIKALARSPHVMNLTRLDLWDNHIGDEGVKGLAESRYLENLSQLDLGRNRLGDEGIKALAASPHFRNLGELLLVSNHIGDEGALALAESPYLANLAWLKPLDNRISAKGADALKKAFGRRVRIM
jgi:serine/threonine protein kinase